VNGLAKLRSRNVKGSGGRLLAGRPRIGFPILPGQEDEYPPHRGATDSPVRADDSGLRGAFRLASGRALPMYPHQSHVASGSGEWQLDDVTLSRLTWLWLAYSLFALATGGRRLPTVCPFRLVTRHRCPLCGLTRSVHHLMRGQVSLSFEQHPAGPVLYLGSAAFLAWAWRSRCRDEHRAW
jgi:hypothetical protein